MKTFRTVESKKEPSFDHRAWEGRIGIREVEVPTYAPNELLVKIHSVAINPADYKVSGISPPGHDVGSDFSGVLVAIGSEVSSDRLKVGDRVAGFVAKGGFAEYLKVQADLVWRIPKAITFEEASTFGVGFTTAAQCLFLKLGVPWAPSPPSEPKKEILVYGASTSVGLFAIQLAKLSGYTVVATCSPHNFELVKSFGADFAYDYRSTTIINDIASSHPNINTGLDCVANGGTTEITVDVIERNGGGTVQVLNPTDYSTPNVKVGQTSCYVLLGEEFRFGGWVSPADPEARNALVQFYFKLPSWITKLGLKGNPVDVRSGGLDGIEDAFSAVEDGKVSGKKLVFNI